MVKPTFDSRRHLNDPDLPLPWQDIVQVLVPLTSDVTHGTVNSDQAGTCPICLSPPTAPRMTRCGHVFCYACLLHYLIVAENGTHTRGSMRHAKRCPICWDDVLASHLKAVVWIDAQHEAQRHRRAFLEACGGEEASETSGLLTLRLVERPSDACMALPRSATWPRELDGRSLLCSHPDALLYARCVRATPEYILTSLRSDIAAIETEMRELQAYEPDELSLEFLRVAHEQLQEQLVTALSMPSMPVERPLESDHSVACSSYFYYQAASGQYVFLHPIDIKVLLSRFQTYAGFPDTLLVAVQGAEEGTVDDALRKKCKYLAHLPMAADVTFVEVDWARTAAAVPESVQPAIPWEPWADVLMERHQRRRNKAIREEKSRKRAEKEPRKHREVVDASLDERYNDHMTFRQAAMVGAEMYFPIHPGAAADDALFPSMPAAAPVRPAEHVAKTVWGTPAASQTHSAATKDAQNMDKAWTSLEERSAHAEEDDVKRSGSKTKRKPKLILTGGGRSAW